MAVHADDLVLLAVAKLYLGSPEKDNDYVQRLITGASQAANKFCHRLLKARATTEIRDGDNSVELTPYQHPINSIATIHQDTTRVFAIGSLVDPTHYIIDQDKRVIFGIKVSWVSGLQTIQLIYNAGYADGSVDSDLELAILMIVDFWYKSFSDHRFGVSSVSIGDKSISYEKTIPKQAQNLLKGFREDFTY